MTSFRGLADLVLVAANEHLGEDATYTPLKSAPATAPFAVRGPFDEAAEIVEMGNEAPVSGTMPVLGVRLADFAVEPAQGDRVTVLGALYEVWDTRPDGQGGMKLLLKRKS
ncbi:hypothetical protein [Parvibaculum sp.]|uniref:head-tail joining protein n=1 Tax=Parvibaculum sp. TaxID=2024848 RepID=UPI00272F2D2F|nr:hypothetical protein [Parvibaculum sp.]MDP1628855.1 hypothetical protein [Parvibaculum sp.]MDP2148250.1 hypothetical protein [Parvibaculum sp.]MDP3327862.1 hypothetical protein [Parvibaculum sp.]